MKEEIYKVQYDESQHLADAKNGSGGKRALVFTEGGRLQEHAVLQPYSDEEMYECCRPRFEAERRISPGAELVYGIIGDYVGQLIYDGATSAANAAVHYAGKFFRDKVVPRAKEAASIVRDINSEPKYRQLLNEKEAQKNDADDELSLKFANRDEPLTKDKFATSESSQSFEVNELQEISEEEASERFARIALLAQVLADEVEDLKHCCVADEKEKCLPENSALLGELHDVLDGDIRLLPRSTSLGYLRLLCSDQMRESIVKLELPDINSNGQDNHEN